MKDLNLKVVKGQIYGILGPNGSGKSTTLGSILGTVVPESGEILWGNEPIRPIHRKAIGSMLETPAFYPNLNAWQNLGIIAKLKELDRPDFDNVLSLTGVRDFADKSFKQYSTGMKQRLGLAAALLGDPEVLILDEPTNALDPQGIADVRNIIFEIAATGKTIILASHLLDEVQKLCTDLAVLKDGHKLFEGSVKGLMVEDSSIEIAASDMNKLHEVLSYYTGIKKFEPGKDQMKVWLKPEYKISELSSFLVTQGLEVTHLSASKGNLEQKILEMLK
ncbi:MAG: ABC transporter ATP-binding protein [Cyclobacteriaceae bacterium]